MAVLSGGWAGRSAVLSRAYVRALSRGGLHARLMGPEEAANPDTLNVQIVSLLVIPDAVTFPGPALKALNSYLKQGGHLVSLGAPAFDRLVQRVDGKWLDSGQIADLIRNTPAARTIVDIGAHPASDWRRSANDMKSPTTWATEHGPPGAGQAIHVTISDLTGWDTLTAPPLADVPHAGENLIVFRAKGGPKTTALAVEVDEKDGSRWIGTAPLTTSWRRYAMDSRDFKLWDPDGASHRQGTDLDLTRTASIGVGLAFTHVRLPSGRHEYWVADIGSASHPPIPRYDPPVYDTLSPVYKCYPIRDARSVTDREGRPLVGVDAPRFLPAELLSTHPRVTGAGFNKGRKWRWIPLIQVWGSDGSVRGTLATLLCHHDDGFGRGKWASFTVGNPAYYARADVQRYVAALARRMLNGPMLVEGGAEWFGVFPGEDIRLGARVEGLTPSTSACRVRITAVGEGNRGRFTYESAPLRPTDSAGLAEALWAKPDSSVRRYVVTTELLDKGRAIDSLRHELTIRRAAPRQVFMTAHDCMFWLGKKPWFPHGVNYMPSSGIAIEDGPYFENWLGPRSYDPEVVERDLTRIQAMGMNMLSVFCYAESAHAHNLIDFLNRCDAHHLKVNLSLRPGTPLDFQWDAIRPIITDNRLANDDTVFAYDLAWEPYWDNYAKRKRWDPEWERWIVRKYGSVGEAERVWGESVPRAAEKVTSPGDADVSAGSKIPHCVAAYRHFLDDLLDRTHSEARRLIRTVDPHHLLSFRMSIGGDPTVNPAAMPYDFAGLARSMDFMSPEGYGRIGGWEQVKPGWFTVAYSRLTAPGRPVMWAEFGYTSWDPNSASLQNTGGSFADRFDARFYPPETVKYIERFYRAFYDMVLKSGSAGSVCWWYPGGFRWGENSDFGIINPDGTWRGLTRIIAEYAPKIENRTSVPKPDAWITVDRDAHPDGEQGIYNACKAEFWKLIAQGHYPGLRTPSAASGGPD